MANKIGSRQRILEFLLTNVGRIIDGEEIREASGNVSEWARRVRELRDEEGYQILTHRDRRDLRPGQYLLETDKRLPQFARSISKETRAYVLERNGYTCQMCGLAAGDSDPFDSTRGVRLTMGHIIDKSKGGSDTPNNLRAICTNCNEVFKILRRPNQIGSICLRKFDALQLMTNCTCLSGWNVNSRKFDSLKRNDGYSNSIGKDIFRSGIMRALATLAIFWTWINSGAAKAIGQ